MCVRMDVSYRAYRETSDRNGRDGRRLESWRERGYSTFEDTTATNGVKQAQSKPVTDVSGFEGVREK